VGLLGVDAGLLWVVAGVFTVRSLTGARPGLAWAIACIGAGLRWGSLGLGDIEVATRLFGPTVASGGPAVRVGMVVALSAALVDEARSAGLEAEFWVERAAAVAALVALVPAFLVSGPGRLASSAVAWVAATVGAVLVVRFARPVARSVPAWLLWTAAAAGVGLAEAVA
jgi:hypothetical protein